MPDEVQILAHKSCTATFTVPNGSRAEIEKAIAERLRSDKELVWSDDPDGIKVDCLHQNNVWRPRTRFELKKLGET